MTTPTDTQSSTLYCVILAGGSGTRFWPRSRQTRPKQLCALGEQTLTMIELTAERILPLVPKERIIVVTHRDQADATRKVLKDKVGAILAEPEARNTGPAISLAAHYIEAIHSKRGSGKPVMISLHADHVISGESKFIDTLKHAVHGAEAGYLTLIGIQPTRPETGFGYLEKGDPLQEQVFRVKRFMEKPALAKAKELLATGGFYWNSGLFVWRTEVLLKELARHSPDLVDPFSNINLPETLKLIPSLERLYSSLPKISIDHGILEKSDRIAFSPGTFAWHDIGSWATLKECFGASDDRDNYFQGDVLPIDVRGSTVVSTTSQLVAVLGLEDMIVVAEADAILVTPKSRAQDVKDVVAALRARDRPELV